MSCSNNSAGTWALLTFSTEQRELWVPFHCRVPAHRDHNFQPATLSKTCTLCEFLLHICCMKAVWNQQVLLWSQQPPPSVTPSPLFSKQSKETSARELWQKWGLTEALMSKFSQRSGGLHFLQDSFRPCATVEFYNGHMLRMIPVFNIINLCSLMKWLYWLWWQQRAPWLQFLRMGYQGCRALMLHFYLQAAANQCQTWKE